MNGRVRAPRPPSEQFWLGATQRWREYEGRSRRYEFGSVVLFGSLALSVVLVVVFGLATASVTAGLVGLALATPIVCWLTVALVAVTVRRLHDIERSGWYALALALPPAAIALLIVLLATDGRMRSNRFGSSPKYF